jgi:hypothetical protein
MATVAQTMNTPGGVAAIGAIGNAISAYQNTKAQGQMLAQQTQQLREQVAFQRKVMEQQAMLRQEEITRQQMLAQAAGSAFADSKKQFADVRGDIGTETNNIADVFRAVLARQGPASVAPTASAPTADYEAAARAQQSGEIGGEANRLAAAQAFGQVMQDKGYALNENDQFASLLRNFGQGSQGASQAEVMSREGQLFQPRITQPKPSMMGDLFVGLSSVYANQMGQPDAPPSKYALELPTRGETGLRPGGTLGIKPTGTLGLDFGRPAGLGIR